MLDPSGRELAYVKEDEPDDDAVVPEEPAHEVDDFDVYDARSPIRSRRQAWWGVGGLLALTILIAWAFQTFIDTPSTVSGQPAPSATLGDMAASPKPGQTPLFQNTVPPTPRQLLVTVIEPVTLGGRARSSEDKPLPPDHLAAMTGGVVVSGAYGELASRDFVVMSAATSPFLLYPDLEIDVLIGHLQAEDPHLTDLLPVPAGPFGGNARCGSSKFSDLDKVVCVWAADQSVGVITWIDQPETLARGEFLALRSQIEFLR